MFRLPWIDANTPLPDPGQALEDPPGLVCAGAPVNTTRLQEAYAKGIFPWYSHGQPPLWWSTDPRMVLELANYRASESLIKLIRARAADQAWTIQLNSCFEQVMNACAQPRPDQDGTWIDHDIIQAYTGLHRLGLAQSIEVFEQQQLIGGLYGVSIGKMFYGESMFSRRSNASKLALFGLVHLLKQHGFQMIDCQQETGHLASMGAKPITRTVFLQRIKLLTTQSPAPWSTLETDMHSLAAATRTHIAP